MTEPELPYATSRELGAVVRSTLQAMGLPWKVRCKTVSFAGLGYGSGVFAKIQAERLLTYIECGRLADALREMVADGVGKGIIELEGPDYSFGGNIHSKDYPTGADFWRRLYIDLVVTPEKDRRVTAVINEASRRVLLAYRAEKPKEDRDSWCKAWTAKAMAHPEKFGECWPDIYSEDDKPEGWPGILAFEKERIKP